MQPFMIAWYGRSSFRASFLSVARSSCGSRIKAVDRAMTIGDIKLLEKSGGRSGHYRRQD